jgi:lipoprotein-anchoring transpeptidase ErfK/SrfK
MTRLSKWVLVFILVVVCGGLVRLFPPPPAPSAITVVTPRPLQPLGEVREPNPPPPPPIRTFLDYLEVDDSCGPYYDGACVNVRSGPGTHFPSVTKLRSGMVLRVVGSEYDDEGREWYRIAFNEWLRYPERITKKWYVAADIVQTFQDVGPEVLESPAETTKRILVDRSEQKLYAYDGDTLFMEQNISTGHDDTPTPRGTFRIFHKTPSRYMQGPVPNISEDEYDLPGVPWTMYFTKQGGALHGAYWHDNFGAQWSHGCVNLPPEKAKELYQWADLGTPVTVRD